VRCWKLTKQKKLYMKIVLVHNFYRQAGGEDVVFQSEKRLLERSGHRVIPYIRSNMELRDDSLLHRIGTVAGMIWSQESRQTLATILDAERPDLVHVHNTFMAISPSIYSACSERGIPVVVTLHNFRLLCPGASFFRNEVVCEECTQHSLFRSVLHRCYRNSTQASAAVALMVSTHRALGTYQKSVTRYIALTHYAKEKFVRAGFPADRFVVKANFAEPDPGEKLAAGEYALFIGRVDPTKGTRVLLDAWNRLPVKYPLHVVGDGPDRQWMEDQVRELRLSEVIFRGRLSHAEALEAVKGARFTVMPSTWYETFGLCIIESFACGTPVLCSRLGAMSEIVDDHVTGLHFNPSDPQDLAEKVEWAWSHPLELASMGRVARRKYESDYTAEKNYSQLMEIYEQAMAACASPGLATTSARQIAARVSESNPEREF
jgi:glycosyltransferase involved in cell wall biosynthesis